MATVRAIIQDALAEIGAIAATETPDAATEQFCLLRFQNQIDAWAADELTLSRQLRTAITWPSSTSSQTIGASGADITAQRPVWVNQLNYVTPGSSPQVEVVIAPMDQDSYAAQSIKDLSSGLPLAFFYQTMIDSLLGSITLWPVPNQQLTLYLYTPEAVDVPTTINSVLLGPPGYQEAFMYQLAKRLWKPLGGVGDYMQLAMNAETAYSRMKMPNVQPGLMGVDAALVPSSGGAYNILSDQNTGFSR